ncbi:hypothetical protein BT96DRAFT_1024859 [Gymnopus androsaceus JB14]|uniref:Uncharacterized protein n=1 Tax=Gymnopus androsaceus JB14 TaxID=1447944 RepID=A0A6A4GVH7_9AGAR|nr:hypothetical protein BT96DRAFT_1024859 [Gymnopus androsaceus JB14]
MAAIVRNVVNWSAQHHIGQPLRLQCNVICARSAKRNPSLSNGGHKHPYCSRTCAAKIVPNMNNNPNHHQQNGHGNQHSGMSSSSGPSPTSTASPATPAPTPTSNYLEAVRLGQVEACEMCRDQPRFTGSGLSRMRVGGPSRKLCVGCDRAARGGAQLRELGNKDSKFQQVRKQFIGEWTIGHEGLPTVDKVYQVLVPREELGRIAAYRQVVEKVPEQLRQWLKSFDSSHDELGAKDRDDDLNGNFLRMTIPIKNCGGRQSTLSSGAGGCGDYGPRHVLDLDVNIFFLAFLSNCLPSVFHKDRSRYWTGKALMQRHAQAESMVKWAFNQRDIPAREASRPFPSRRENTSGDSAKHANSNSTSSAEFDIAPTLIAVRASLGSAVDDQTLRSSMVQSDLLFAARPAHSAHALDIVVGAEDISNSSSIPNLREDLEMRIHST